MHKWQGCREGLQFDCMERRIDVPRQSAMNDFRWNVPLKGKLVYRPFFATVAFLCSSSDCSTIFSIKHLGKRITSSTICRVPIFRLQLNRQYVYRLIFFLKFLTYPYFMFELRISALRRAILIFSCCDWLICLLTSRSVTFEISTIDVHRNLSPTPTPRPFS